MEAKWIKYGTEEPVLLDTSMDSDNCGDQIIMQNCEEQLKGIIECEKVKRIPTHRYLTEAEKCDLLSASYKILCGTNILSGKMRQYGLWKLTEDISVYKNTILMGVGFDSECEEYDLYTKRFLKTILAPDVLHSVRDRFSERILKKMGIKNVIYTGCPTMWKLTPEICKKIPRKKGKNVVCTLTDYCCDPEMDKKMVDILSYSYEKVYLWLQGNGDYSYAQSLGIDRKVIYISKDLREYDLILQKTELDYVGTRLHAGIRAISLGHRSIVIAIDNRARCIARDTGLMVLERTDIPLKLEKLIEASFFTNIALPIENISRWKKQFGSE